MGWKKILAREWLYFLGFIPVSAIIGLSIYFILKPTKVEEPPYYGYKSSEMDELKYSFSAPSSFDPLEHWNDNLAGQIKEVLFWNNSDTSDYLLVSFNYDSTKTKEWKKTRNSITNIMQDSPPLEEENLLLERRISLLKLLNSRRRAALRSAQNKLKRSRDDYGTYRDKSELAANISIVFSFFMYPIFLFIRSIRWAYRQIRTRPSIE